MERPEEYRDAAQDAALSLIEAALFHPDLASRSEIEDLLDDHEAADLVTGMLDLLVTIAEDRVYEDLVAHLRREVEARRCRR